MKQAKDADQQSAQLEELQLAVHTMPEKASTEDKAKMSDIMEPNTSEESLAISEYEINLEQLEELKRQNEDMIGWITIEDTTIDYPVMYTKNSGYYLDHNFNQEKSIYGVPYVDEKCDLFNGCDNIIIHGHHMKDGTMFAPLLSYKEEEFYKKHPYIYVTLSQKTETYEIFGVFQGSYETITEESFLYYQFTKAKDVIDFDSYVDNVNERSMYKTGITPSYGDQLLTLSTCDRSLKEGRFIVVAKKVE